MAIEFLKGIFDSNPRYGATYDTVYKEYTLVDLDSSKIIYNGKDFNKLYEIFSNLLKTNEKNINYNDYKIMKNVRNGLYDLYYKNVLIATLDSYSEALHEMEADYDEKTALNR